MELVIIGLIGVVILGLIIVYSKVSQKEKIDFSKIENQNQEIGINIKNIMSSLKDEFRSNREELANLSNLQREEMKNSLSNFGDSFEKEVEKLNALIKAEFKAFKEDQNKLSNTTEERISRVKDAVSERLKELQEDNSKKLEEVRKTVDEKLQKTLNDRLTQSFKTVGDQLHQVQQGLGEMRTLATDVGGLKKVLSNVKLRGGIGEVQLEMLLEQILAPDQYEANVMTKKGSQGVVEFAIKLPGKDDHIDQIWLPIDAKFPKDVYETLQDAYDSNDLNLIESAQKDLENTIKKMAKDISDKYIDPPHTTNFAILFLPFEGIYSEVVRKASLLETLQKDYNIIVTGPTTLAAILNSLQMGFRTLAIEKRSGEVWKVLGAVKKEFENFGGVMQKAHKNISQGLNHLDNLVGTRSRAIQRTLKDVEASDQVTADLIFPEMPALIEGEVTELED